MIVQARLFSNAFFILPLNPVTGQSWWSPLPTEEMLPPLPSVDSVVLVSSSAEESSCVEGLFVSLRSKSNSNTGQACTPVETPNTAWPVRSTCVRSLASPQSPTEEAHDKHGTMLGQFNPPPPESIICQDGRHPIHIAVATHIVNKTLCNWETEEYMSYTVVHFSTCSTMQDDH
ncbi:hypothetical protein EMCRGX_G033706 [Ephydatia muelleri]